MTAGPQRDIRIIQPRVEPADPHTHTDSADLLSLRFAVYEPLVRRAGPGIFTPALATAWSCAPDARTWTFQLREAPFHDGTPLTPADVAASLQRVSDPSLGGEMATAGVLASYLSDARVEPLGDSVRVVTPAPMADLLDLLADIAITRRDAPPLGTGPYRVIARGQGTLTLEAFARHWQGLPAVHRLHWRGEPSETERVAALLAGEADLISGIGPAGRDALVASGRARVTETPGSTCVTFMLNCATGPCVDRRVRRALNLGLDVERIIAEVAGGAAERANGPFTVLHEDYDPATPPYPHDPPSARALLAEAGYADGLDLTIDIPTRLPDEAPALGRRLVEHLAAINVRVTLHEHADRVAYAHLVREKRIADGCCFDSSPLSTFRVLREKFHSGLRGPWWQGYANSQVDGAIDQAAATVDPRARHALYRRAARIIHDDAPWIFLYAPRVLHGVGPRLPDWQPGLNGVIHAA